MYHPEHPSSMYNVPMTIRTNYGYAAIRDDEELNLDIVVMNEDGDIVMALTEADIRKLQAFVIKEEN